MTEDQIEAAAEKKMDILDSRLVKGKITQEEYDREVNELDQWVKKQYNKM